MSVPSSILDRIRGTVSEKLLPEGPYLIAPGDREGTRHAPSALLFELLVWNVVVAFFVNVAAGAAFEWLRARMTPRDGKELRLIHSIDEIREVQTELARAIGRLSREQKKAALTAPPAIEIELVLTEFGLPARRAKTLAPDLDSLLRKTLREEMSETNGEV